MKQFTQPSKKEQRELNTRIRKFMDSKMEIFPELRHQPEMTIEETGTDKRTIGQWLHDALNIGQSIRS